MINILIINQHTNNFGDDIAAKALIDKLINNNNVFEVHILYNTLGTLWLKNKKIHHDTHINLKSIGRLNLILYFISKILKCNYLGNSTLHDFINCIGSSDIIYVSPGGANIGIYQDWKYLIMLVIVCMEGKTPIFYLNTIGRSRNFIFDSIARYVLSNSKLYVREKKSLDYLSSIGLKSQLGVDVAFSGGLLTHKKVSRIGFVPTTLSDWHPNFKNMQTDATVRNDIIDPMISFAKAHKLEIALIPHLRSDIEDKYILEIYHYIRQRYSNVSYLNNVYDADDYEKAIASSKYIVGMRYHAIVLAAKNFIPFIAVSYENKMNEVCNYTGMQEYQVKLYDGRSRNNIEGKLKKLSVNYSIVIKALDKVNKEKLRHLAELPLSELVKKL